MQTQSEDTGELTTVIDPASIVRMASSRPDNRETTMYGKHGKHNSKPVKVRKTRVKPDRPKRPAEQIMPFVMLAISIVYAAGMVPLLWFMPVSEPEDMIVRPILTGLIGMTGGFRRRSGLGVFLSLASRFTEKLNLKHFLVILESTTFKQKQGNTCLEPR